MNDHTQLSDNPLLDVTHNRVWFDIPSPDWWQRKKQILKAVDDVSFQLREGETLGVVGESGCGKSTLVRGILGLESVTDGSVKLYGVELTGLDKNTMRGKRRDMQIIFQDPLASLDPRMTVSEIISEPLIVFQPELSKKERKRKVQQIMQRVGLLPNQINRYPHEFSGGQAQRIGIARALILKPKLLICDEPVSALDVSIQAQIINLLMDLQQEMGLSMIFIAHDLSVVKHISHRVMVMYMGKVVEMASRDDLFRHPRHPYTKALMESIPIPDPAIERAKRGAPLTGDLPSPMDPPSGCNFRTRCPLAQDICAAETPEWDEKAPDHWVACHFPVN
ncbi:MAG: murein tripeptide/oligopeptide ABC transporter ATP binding protein OppF [Gammaproteobacteria bacterium]|nr:MAG: murein tripeptide/oligopeptide ABC transporter ATP binding protein OppF [Gammaproteobacteria bacterium]